ncbi:MAG: S4 domain-containing protein [Schleiferiaceae bacterium]
METGIRLNKFLSSHGLCSRREADRAIEAGQVRLNGRPAVLGDLVKPGDEVSLNGRKVRAEEKPRAVYLLLNKPEGITRAFAATWLISLVIRSGFSRSEGWTKTRAGFCY